MSSKKAELRERLHLPTLVLDPRTVLPREGSLLEAIFTDSRSTAPLRALLERRSVVTFIADLHGTLCSEGLDGSKATDALYHAINSPTLAVRRRKAADRRTDVLQAVALDDPSTEGIRRSVLVVMATIIDEKPPRVASAAVDLLPIDWEELDDLCALSVEVEAWWRDYEVRSVSHPYEDAPVSLGWLGHPTPRLYRGVPEEWEATVSALGAALGLRTLIARTPHEAAAQALHERVDFALVVNGTSGWDRIKENFEGLEKDLLQAGSPGTDFQSLLAEARRAVIPYVLGCIEPVLDAPRVLSPGETVYHRKLSSQPRTYDRFDKGSPTPCSHGASGFVRWSGDKAIKGLRRRYPNFDGSMLFHCPKFPNCGMYAARGR